MISLSTPKPGSTTKNEAIELRGVHIGEPSSEGLAEVQPTYCPPVEDQTARLKFGEQKPAKWSTTRSRTLSFLTEGKKALKHRPFTVRSQLKGTLFSSWINVLLFAVPAGFVVNYMNLNSIAVFFVNFVAILPLNSIFTIAIDEVRLRTSNVGGILIYMSLG
jgi:hypothetical protein